MGDRVKGKGKNNGPSIEKEKNERQPSSEEENDMDGENVDGDEKENRSATKGSERPSNADGKARNSDQGDMRRMEIVGNMEKIEKEFADLKEKFFKDKIQSLKREIEAIKNGVHPHFASTVRELELSRDEKINQAEQWRRYQLQNIENIFASEKNQAEEEFKGEKRQLKERMINNIVDRGRRIIEERSSLSLNDGIDSRSNSNTRQLRRRAADSKSTTNAANAVLSIANGINNNNLGGSGQFDRDTTQFPLPQKRKLNPPHINYTLRESEIEEDLKLIMRGQSTR
eukprot:TRINITY_DN6665_c0_g1_i1.p1 TRINITY_DN6665_c0_g1~~TRINITY_DN6665_c0_g1_i1.p1  ORF type:complete len:285 (+),score=69.50 TRINITY_DN6665_c0_g1_i1:378-1232(+)